MYYRPKLSVLGPLPPEDREIIRAFLKDDRFLATSCNYFNNLGLGLTQLHNQCRVYNYKRHARVVLGGSLFDFRRVSRFPRTLSKEFLLVDLLNQLPQLGEERTTVIKRVRDTLTEYDAPALEKCVHIYGRASTRDLIGKLYANRPLPA